MNIIKEERKKHKTVEGRRIGHLLESVTDKSLHIILQSREPVNRSLPTNIRLIQYLVMAVFLQKIITVVIVVVVFWDALTGVSCTSYRKSLFYSIHHWWDLGWNTVSSLGPCIARKTWTSWKESREEQKQCQRSWKRDKKRKDCKNWGWKNWRGTMKGDFVTHFKYQKHY